MNKILILKDLAYAASSGAAIATIADLDRLVQGAVAVFDQNGDIIAPAALTGTYTNIFFAVGLDTNHSLSVPIPVVVDKWNVEAYRAAVKPVVQVGDSLTTAQVDSITLAGTSGTANVTVAGGLTKLSTFNTDLATTASDFVTAHAAAYLAEGITLTTTSTGATNGVLVFTATVPGVSFDNPVITNATGDLAGTVVNTTANKSATTTLQFLDTGEYSITVLDNTFTNKYAQDRKDASGYRQTYMTEEDVVDDVVTKLNADSFIVATKNGNATDGWGISITTKEDGVIINVSVGGMFEGTPVYTDGTKGSVVQIFSLGAGADVKQLEQDFSVFEGNSNSIEYTDEYFSKPLEALAAINYEMINLLWKGLHATPSANKTVMNNRLVIAGVDGSTVLDNIQTILAGILTTTGSKTVA